MKALIIEDDANVSEAVALCFQLRWPEVNLTRIEKGKEALDVLRTKVIDMVILDINLPDISGFDVLQELRTFSDVPVVILTVQNKEDDQVKGLELGADDYIVKPFKPRDLIARVNSVLRRMELSKKNDKSPVVTIGNISLNLSKNQIEIGNRVEKLTPNETQVLYTLMNNPGKIISSENISEAVWGKVFPDNNRIRTYIRRLRIKLDDTPPVMIRSKRGKGYAFFAVK
ncbi:MAG: response regulator transcription factor [Chitinispirillaceae bacterium]|nr:response regulator transcription factor [Chitinispirillaceae bacterium]